MGDESKGKMTSQSEQHKSRLALEQRIAQLERSRRRLVGLLVVLLLGLTGVGLFAEGLRRETSALQADIRGAEARLEVRVKRESRLDPEENAAKLQAVLDNTNAELRRTKEKLEKATALAQERLDNPPLEKTRETVAGGLGNFRSALNRVQEKLTDLNERSTGKGEQRGEE